MASTAAALAQHTVMDRITTKNPEIKKAHDLLSKACKLFEGMGMKPVLALTAEMTESGEKIGAIYQKCIRNEATTSEITAFCDGLVRSDSLSLSFWTERYDSIVVIIHTYHALGGEMKGSIEKVNAILNILHEEIDKKPSLLTSYSHLAEAGEISFDVWGALTDPTNKGFSNEILLAALEEHGASRTLLNDMDVYVEPLQNFNGSFEGFVALANAKCFVGERQLDLDLIEKNILAATQANPDWAPPSFEKVKAFFTGQINGKSHVPSTALFYFLLFLDRFSQESGQRSGETGLRKEINVARGDCRWKFTEKLWGAICRREINLDFFRTVHEEEFTGLFEFMKAAEQANYEVCITMGRLGMTEPGEEFHMERPTVIQWMMDKGLLRQIFDHVR